MNPYTFTLSQPDDKSSHICKGEKVRNYPAMFCSICGGCQAVELPSTEDVRTYSQLKEGEVVDRRRFANYLEKNEAAGRES